MTAFDLVLPGRRVSGRKGLEIALAAEGRGWRGLWCSEVLALDCMTFLGAVAARTTGLRLGTAVVPLTTRSAALLAMGASTLASIAPGRFVLGIGTSTPAIVDERHDRPVGDRPLALARGTLSVIQAALRGERVDHESSPAVSGLRIEAPDQAPTVGLAALGPKMSDLAIEAADALFLNLCTSVEGARRARFARERRGADYETFLLVRVVVDPTTAERDALLKEVTSYARVPVYSRMLADQGLDIDGVVAAATLDDAVEAAPPELLDELAVLGSAADCRARLEAFVSAGVTPLVVPAAGDGNVHRVIDALAP